MRVLPSLALCALIGCTSSGPLDTSRSSPDSPEPGGEQDLRTSLKLIDHVSPYDPQSWQFELLLAHPAPIDLTCEEQGNPDERHVVSRGPSLRHRITVAGLKAATTYSCVAELTDGSGRTSAPTLLTTAPLPVDLVVPKITVAADDPSAVGYLLVNIGQMNADFTYSGNYLVVLGPAGNVRWYYRGVGGGDIDASYLGNGQFLFGGFAGGYSHVAPTIVGLDKQVIFEATSDVTYPQELAGTFNHDAGLSQDGKSIFTLTDELAPDASYSGFVVKQIDIATNSVIWGWDSFEDGVASGVLPPGSVTNNDPYHANAVDDRWEDGRLYIYLSIKHLNQIFKIDYATRKVVWRLGINGDFKLLEPDGSDAADSRWFFFQHDAKVVGSNLVLYDNGINRSLYGGVDFSRALSLEVDEQNMTARIAQEFTEDNWLEPIWGGYDLLPNGQSLIAMGHCWLCSSGHDSALVMLNQDSTVMWRAEYDSSRTVLYRAQRIDGCALFNNSELCGG